MEVRNRLNYRVSLDNLGRATLGVSKTADGLKALQWWKEGRIDLIGAYCEADVDITRRLYEFGRAEGHVLFTSSGDAFPWNGRTSGEPEIPAAEHGQAAGQRSVLA